MKCILILTFILVSHSNIFADIISQESSFDYETTVTKIKQIITDNNFEIIATIDHSKSAKINKLYLLPSQVLIFGNAQLSTSLIQNNPLWGMYLPLKISIYNNTKGQTWIVIPNISKQEKQAPVSDTKDKKKIAIISTILNQILNIK